MAFGYTNDLKHLLHPYIFVLKEGPHIEFDFFNFQLMMLQITCPEVIKSPTCSQPKASASTSSTSELDLLKSNIKESLFKKTKISS
jgi:hypothetical protein